MARTARILLPLALTLLILSPTSLAQQWGAQPFFPLGQSGGQHRRLQRGQQQLNDCQINQLSATEPTVRHQAEAGVTEVWDPSEQQEFQCAGVVVVRHEIEPKGLLVPHYHNAPSISYVIRGRGLLGVSGVGCPETYESGSPESFSEESRRSERGREHEGSRRSEREREHEGSRRSEESRRFERGSEGFERLRDQHQKVRRIHKGHVLALPAGVTKWFFNDGEDRLTLITLFDTNNFQNQLDDILRSFFLAGNPQGRGEEQGRHHEMRRQHHQSSRGGRQSSRGSEESTGENSRNMLSGFDQDLLSQCYDVGREVIEKIQGQNDDRGAIILVKGDLELLLPEWDREEQRRERHRGGRGEEQRRERRHHRGGRFDDNGLEETVCSARLTENIDNPEHADVFNPQGGRLTSVNSHKLPILNYLRLSAEKVNLYQNAIMAPNWKINAHSIVYFTKGSGRVQIASHEGRLVFDDVVQEGQLLVVPQNFVVLKRAGREGLEWVAFLTSGEAMISPLAGRISAIRGMPVEVVMNSYGLSREEAQRLKYGRQELSVFSPSERSDRRGERFAIV